MLSSLSILLAILIAVPGLLVPLHVSTRMFRVLVDDRRHATEKIFAGGTMIAMLLLMGFTVYAVQEISAMLNALASLTP